MSENTENPFLLRYKGAARFLPIRGVKVSAEDLRRLYQKLDEKASEAVENHLSAIPPLANKTQEEDEKLREEVKELGQLTISMFDDHGEQIVSQSIQSLSDERIPDKISYIAFDSSAGLKTQNFQIQNAFKLELDFSDTPGFHLYNPLDDLTPNNSGLQVSGPDTSWVTGVIEVVSRFFQERKASSTWIHSRRLFVCITWLILFPISFWITYRLDTLVMQNIDDLHSALRGCLNIYLFLFSFFLLRQMLWAIRWAYPVIELDGSKKNWVRRSIEFAGAAIFLGVLTDVIQQLFV